MYVMFVLIGFSLLVALIFLGIFIWAVRSGQFEDHYTPSVRALFDDEKKAKSENENTSKHDTQEQRSTD
ncbi:MAG: cbb3-type cytochrome oxidase assembly protein CcoS [Bacteroidota bacterium]|nr:cbb3-type cytochrome oxidase assembly protein CcoS [Bacteroidota bacterium]